MNEKEIKDYVIRTIQHGKKDRIIEVLKRYYAHMKTSKKDVYDEAKEIFNV